MDLKVKEIIKQKGLTMQEIADRLSITRDTLTRNINGNPTIETLKKISDVLEVPISDLFEQPHNDTINCPYCGGKIKVSKD